MRRYTYLFSLFIAMVFTAIAYVVVFSSDGFNTQDDPFYHLKHTETYVDDELLQGPQYSTYSLEGDMYYLSHKIPSIFLIGVDGQDYVSKIARIKYFYVLVIGAYFGFFYILSSDFVMGLRSSRSLILFGFIACFFLYSSSPTFTFRLFMLRPAIISSFMVMIIVYALLKKKNALLFVASIIYPLMYPASFIAICCASVYVFCDVMYARKKIDKVVMRPILITVTGVLMGILLHPNTYYYLLNAYYGHIQFFLGLHLRDAIFEGREYDPYHFMVADSMWVIPLLGAFYLSLSKILNKRSLSAITFNQFYLGMLSGIFALLTIRHMRSIEYGLVFMTLYIAITIQALQIPISKTVGMLLSVGVICVGIFYVYIQTNTSVYLYKYQPTFDQYREAAHYLHTHSNEGDIVFNQILSQYPRLVFYNNHNRYVSGQNSISSYLYDKEKYWLYWHITQGHDLICSENICDGEKDRDMYDVIKNDFNARFVFIDNSRNIGWYPAATSPEFFEKISRDARFVKVFEDSENQIYVFEI